MMDSSCRQHQVTWCAILAAIDNIAIKTLPLILILVEKAKHISETSRRTHRR
jgi:hypothetical protein